MDVRELKNYIYDNNYTEQILEAIGCHHIKHHSSGDYYTCANPDGDNTSAIVVYNTEYMMCTNYTRNMVSDNRSTDIVDLVMFTQNLTFPQALKHICEICGLSYYHDFEENIPESFKILAAIKELSSNYVVEKEEPLKPIPEKILSYYLPYVNDLFKEDNIDYHVQQYFEVGYDETTNRYTIPIRSELGDLVGVKGRYFDRVVPQGENKYIYLMACAKSKIVYGLDKTIDYVINAGRIYVGESEKFCMQLFSYGFYNCGSIGGKKPSRHQLDLLIRLGVEIVFCFDKDVTDDEYKRIKDMIPEGITAKYMLDSDNLLEGHESPSDNETKWRTLVENNIYVL